MCDTMVVVRPVGVLFAKNSDRDPNESQPLEWVAGADHLSGSSIRCTWIEIPQVRRTNTILISRPFWMWGAEMGANEHGVTIGNEAVFTTQPYARSGLTGMDLLRLALERADTAVAAVETIVELLAAHGQGGGCGHENRRFTYHNSFLVADGTEAWVLETAGEKWETEHITAGARSISNGLTIRPFAAEHSDRLKTGVSACRIRQPRSQSLAAAAIGPGDLAAVLRDHGDSPNPSYSWLNGGLSAPCVHAGGLVTASQTTASWIAELQPERARHWVTASAAPCTGVFKPVAVSAPLDLGAAPGDRYDPGHLWWRHERVHRRAVMDPGEALPTLAEIRRPLELAAWDGQVGPAEALIEAESALERWLRTDAPTVDRRPWYVRRYWGIRNRRAGLAA